MSLYRSLFALLTIVILLGVVSCGSGSAAGGNSSPTAPVSTTGPASGGCPASSGLPANVNGHGTVVDSGIQLSVDASDFFLRPTCGTGAHGGTCTLSDQ